MDLATVSKLKKLAVGATLSEIRKRGFNIKLFFNNDNKHQRFTMSFEGLVFETLSPASNRKVTSISLKPTVGFKAITQLRLRDINPVSYFELFIEMEGTNSENKIELVCVFEDFRLKRIIEAEKVHQ